LFARKNCETVIQPTPPEIRAFNEAHGKKVDLSRQLLRPSATLRHVHAADGQPIGAEWKLTRLFMTD
jgi:hypothetical protein